MSPFSAPFFWGTQKRGLLLPKRVAALWEGTQWCKGGTGKAESRQAAGRRPTIRREGAMGVSFTRGRQASAPRAAGTCIGTMKLLARR